MRASSAQWCVPLVCLFPVPPTFAALALDSAAWPSSLGDPKAGSAEAHRLLLLFLPAQVVDLTQRYDQLRLNEVRDTFAALQKEYGNAMSWLFSLRNSALFLALWREVAVKIMRQEVPYCAMPILLML